MKQIPNNIDYVGSVDYKIGGFLHSMDRLN